MPDAKKKINTDKKTKKYNTMEVYQEYETDLEEALERAGVGKYQLFHCALMVASLSSAVLEIIGNSFILPSAACDLKLPNHLRGIVTSVPNLGVIITAPVWGWAADSLGRKPVLQLSCLVSGIIGLVAAFSTTLTSYAVCKFVASLFLSCPSSLGWAFIGEMMPKGRRDTALLISNGFLMLSSVLSPLVAWGILSHEWQYLNIRSWRLLTVAYALPLVLISIGVYWADESPKFLVAKGKKRRALEVLKRIYALNSGLPADTFCVTSLRDDSERMATERGQGCVLAKWRGDSGLTLLRPPHIKWLVLTGFLMFGVFSLLNGLFLLAPDTINKALSSSFVDEGNICNYIDEQANQTIANNTQCVDTISHTTFAIMVTSTLVYSGVVIAVLSVSALNKRTVLVSMFATVGVACFLSAMQNNTMVAAVAMSSMQLTALGIGPLNAYAVHLFPTSLRGSAVGAVMMFGRLGSVIGANTAGYFLAVACMPTFYTFSALLFLCAGLSFLLPEQRNSSCPRDEHLPAGGR